MRFASYNFWTAHISLGLGSFTSRDALYDPLDSDDLTAFTKS